MANSSVQDLNFDHPLDRELVAADPDVLTAIDGPVLIDEWQRLPEVWDRVRRAVDAGSPRGHFIIAGSSAPRGAVVHSGAGRIIPLRMRPLSIAEREIEEPVVSLRKLLQGQQPTIRGETQVNLRHYVEEIIASGFPGIRDEPDQLRRDALDGYLRNIVQREFPEQGFTVRKPETLRRWLAAYAAATATTTSYDKILRAAASAHGDKPAKTTVLSYRDALSSLWLLDAVPAWHPTNNHLTRLTLAEKHHLADPALAARLLGLDADTLLRVDRGTPRLTDGTFLGALFEHLVALSVQTYADAARSAVHHLRTRGGDHEIDLIVQGSAGRVLAIEVKLGGAPGDEDVKHLHWLKTQIGDDLIDAVVVTAGPYAYRRKDGIAVVPAALLGP